MSETPPHIRRAARRLRLVTLFGIALVELLILFAAWVLAAGRAADFPALEIRTEGLAPWPAAGILLLFGLLLGLALLKLVAMLRQIEGGAPFAAAGLRGFARYLFLAVLATVLAPPVLHAAAGARRIDLSLGSGAALMLLVTGLLFFVARLLDEAQRLADDHSQIV
ncbi:MAG TPA: hypothetical protein VGO55_03665 [Allosphingosinicella sp.]|jgi:hypothetical protein|nr:hypothetical protein [Allosphingosinicella sp.]